MDDRKRAKLLIVTAFMVFAIIPLLIGIIVIWVQLSSRISVKDAFRTSVNNNLAQAVIEQNNINPDQVVMHGIVNKGDWGALGVFSKEANVFGEVTIVIVHKEGNEYKTIAVGSSFDNGELQELGVPSSLIREVEETDVAARYTEALYNSEFNPRNKYPLIQKLPYKSDDLRISYYFRDDLVDEEGVSIPIITIRGVDAAERKRAFDIIEEYGYDLGSYRIEFINFNNVFAEEEDATVPETDDEDDGEGP